jgi:hypothetical protein
MKNADDIKRIFEQAVVETNPSKDEKILEKMTAAFNQTHKAQSERIEPNIWRIIMKSKITKLAAAAVIIAAVVIGINRFGIDGSGKVFAAAIDSIKRARTFSCIESFEAAKKNGEKYVFEQTWMFKEPDRERHVYLSVMYDKYIGQVTITHYGKRQQLELNPIDKTAILYDISSDYVVNPNTGLVELRHLDTSLHDRLLEMSIGAVEDIGSTKLDGKTVRMFQSRGENWTTTVWVEPRTNLPIQIQIEWPDKHRSPVTYASIQIDGELDDNLFSLELPEGYQLKKFTDDWPVNKKKMAAKIMHLLLKCAEFNGKHNGQYPRTLADLEEVGVSDEVLKIIRSSPDDPDGPSVIQYRQPQPNVDWTKEVILYEAYDQWPVDGVVVGFADSHCEIVHDQKYFDGLLK